MKRSILPVSLAAVLGVFFQYAAAAQYDLLVGTYTQGSSEGIYRYSFDSHNGLLSSKPLQVVNSSNPSWLTLSADRQRLFVVNENEPGQVSSFAIAAYTHELSLINQVQSQSDAPTYSSLSADQAYLFVANYAVQPEPGGSLNVLPVAANGELAAGVQVERHGASHVNPERQASSHVHSVVSSQDGRYVFASDLGADKVFVYRFDPQNKARPLTAANPPAVTLPPGSGPRHLVFGANGKHAYLTLEMSAQVVVFDYQDATLVQRQVLELTTSSQAAAKAGGAIHMSADGKFLYVSNRGTANELSVFAIAPQTGLLTLIQRRSVEGDHPREFSLDPSGKFLLVANQKSNEVVVFERDPNTGLLGRVVQALAVDSPADLKFID